jgi:hypothetical protein
MRTLDPGYTAEVDLIGQRDWDNLLQQFTDASFYQTWAFGAIHSGEKVVSHFVLKKNNRIIGMAQSRIAKVNGLRAGLAMINSGPMYKNRNEVYRIEHLRNIIRALYNEYVLRRGYMLRIIPNKVDLKENRGCAKIYAEEGYSHDPYPGETVIVDLSGTLEEIRKNMDRKWRQTLQAAERKNPDIVEGTSSEICRMALQVIKEMKNRKGFLGGNQAEAIRVHLALPEILQLKFAVCVDNHGPNAALGWVTLGEVGLPLVAATGDRALKTSSSYVLWWKMLEYYKKNGFCAVDMGGVNKKRNPGGYYFKTHILGKRLNEQPRYIVPFIASPNSLISACYRVIQKTREIVRNIQSLA